MFGKSKWKVGDIIEPLLDEEQFAERETLAYSKERPQVRSFAVASSVPPASEATSSISSGLSIVGKIFGQGKLGIFGQVQGEVHASIVDIGEGAQVEGDIVAEELTIGGRIKGTIHANRVKLVAPLWLRAISIIALWQSRRMRNSRECHDDKKMSSIRPRLSQRTAHRHRPSTSTHRATAHRTASIHRRRGRRCNRRCLLWANSGHQND